MEGLADQLNAAVNQAGARAEATETRQQRRRDTQPGVRSVLDGSAAYLPSMQVRDMCGPDTVITVSESDDSVTPIFRAICTGRGVVGKVISESKELALESACDEFLYKLQAMYPSHEITPVSCPDGIRVNPIVFGVLEEEFGTVECDVTAISNEGELQFKCVVKCKNRAGVEQTGQATGADVKWTKLEAAKKLWKVVKNAAFPTFRTYFDEEFDKMTSIIKNWKECQKDPYDTDTDDELENLVFERERERKRVIPTSGDTDDELDELVNFSKNNP